MSDAVGWGYFAALLAFNIAWGAFGFLQMLMLNLHIAHRRLLEHEAEQQLMRWVAGKQREFEEHMRQHFGSRADEILGPRETLH